jgi:hypothetical protein
MRDGVMRDGVMRDGLEAAESADHLAAARRVVEANGFEPMTLWLQTRCSTN